MEAGDLLIQPSWTWHGTKNTGNESALWLTAMDTPLNDFLDAYFREKYPDGFLQPFTKPDGYHMKQMGMLRGKYFEAKLRYPVKYVGKTQSIRFVPRPTPRRAIRMMESSLIISIP